MPILSLAAFVKSIYFGKKSTLNIVQELQFLFLGQFRAQVPMCNQNSNQYTFPFASPLYFHSFLRLHIWCRLFFDSQCSYVCVRTAHVAYLHVCKRHFEVFPTLRAKTECYCAWSVEETLNCGKQNILDKIMHLIRRMKRATSESMSILCRIMPQALPHQIIFAVLNSFCRTKPIQTSHFSWT